jgi:hypothetical protein
MKRISLLILLFLLLLSNICLKAEEPKLKPLSEVALGINWSKPDSSEVAYAAMRCGALYNAMGVLLEIDSKSERDRALSKSLKDKAAIAMKCSHVLNLVMNGMSDEAMMVQSFTISGIYTLEMSQNKLLNNTYFTPFIEKEFDTAKVIYPLIDELNTNLAGKINNLSNKK